MRSRKLDVSHMPQNQPNRGAERAAFLDLLLEVPELETII